MQTLLLVDIDEVVLEFVTPFAAFIRTRNLEFIEDRFSSPHNIIDPASGLHVSVDQAAALAKEFWHRQSDWQRPVPMAGETLHLLSACCDIILLTAMSREHESARREHLNALSLPYEMVIADRPKGEMAMRLAARDEHVVLIDDTPNNLTGLLQMRPGSTAIHLMAHQPMRRLFFPLPAGIEAASSWEHAGQIVLAKLSGFGETGR